MAGRRDRSLYTRIPAQRLTPNKYSIVSCSRARPTWLRLPVGFTSFRGSFGASATIPYPDRKSTRLNSSHGYISYAVFCLKKKKNNQNATPALQRHYVLPHAP